MSFSRFHPLVREWFTAQLGEPTLAQHRGWESIANGRHTLIAAPTGSGKTLAAFLTAINDLMQEGLESPLPDEVRVLYISPLKALSADIHKNLAEPRFGIHALAEAAGVRAPKITAAVRTGDTTASERAAMIRTPRFTPSSARGAARTSRCRSNAWRALSSSRCCAWGSRQRRLRSKRSQGSSPPATKRVAQSSTRGTAARWISPSRCRDRRSRR
jgi:Rad3-related DNA helicase